MTTILSPGETDTVIPRLTEALERTNASTAGRQERHDPSGAARGMTTRQLAERLGISRQLVERLPGRALTLRER